MKNIKSHKKIKKIMYFHYQLSELDGSNTHTSAFEYWFKEICDTHSIDFKIQAPKLTSTAPPLKINFLSKIKRLIAQFYLRDFHVLWKNYQQKKKEITILKQEKPDIVLTRFERETVSIIWACQSLNIPIVLEINSPDIEAITSHYLSLPFFKKLFSTPYVLSKSLGAFTVTHNLTNQVLKSSYKNQTIKTIPNGVDIKKFTPDIDPMIIRSKLEIDKKTIVLGFIGSFAPWHGIDMIAETFPKLIDAGYNIQLVLVGQVQSASDTLINNLLNSTYKDKISVTGFIPLENIPMYLSAMDITILANTEDYCSPLKIFEYMAMGKAVLSVKTEAVCHIMAPEKEGLVFERGNKEEFYSQLKTLISDEKLRKTLGASAREKMVKQFQWKHNAESVYDLIQTCYQNSTNNQ